MPATKKNTKKSVARATVNLSEVENQLGITVKEIEDIKIRKSFAWFMMVLFFLLNLVALFLVFWFSHKDSKLFALILEQYGESITLTDLPEIRVVTPEVMMSLLGATAVQVGASIYVMTNYLFPKQSDE